jgi:hypothetical protein
MNRKRCGRKLSWLGGAEEDHEKPMRISGVWVEI